MKIISKFKDYYDYLVGIYGEDSNLVLDRRKTDKIDVSCLNDTIIEFYIGGYKIQGFAHDSKIYYGDDIKRFKYNRKKTYSALYNLYPNKNKENYVEIEINRNIVDVCTTIEIDEKNYNKKYDCPILVYINRKFGDDKDFLKYCKLDEFNLNSFIDPTVIYQYIYDFLSKQKTEKENQIDNRNDVQKLESFGFDKKTSFRGK